MRFSLTSLVRFIGFLSLGSTLMAVGVSRAVPRVPVLYSPATPRYYGVDGAVFLPPLDSGYILDASKGILQKVELEGGASLEHATCSPWVDRLGRFELLGRTTLRVTGSLDSIQLGASLSEIGSSKLNPRMTTELNPVISGRPCWLPETPTRVIVPAGDGRLYRVELGPTFADGRADPELVKRGTSSSSEARPLEWACTPPGDGPPILNDPVAPRLGLHGNVIVVSLSACQQRLGQVVFGASELWWLELDASALRIRAAGRLTSQAKPTADTANSPRDTYDDERLANFVTLPDGRVLTAYLCRSPGQMNWRLVATILQRDSASTRPLIDSSSLVPLAQDVAVTTPGFSPDGEWVYQVDRISMGGIPSLRRLSAAIARLDRSQSAKTDWVATGSRPWDVAQLKAMVARPICR